MCYLLRRRRRWGRARGSYALEVDGGSNAASQLASERRVDLGILRPGSRSGRAKKNPVFYLAARTRPDPVAGP